MGNQGCQGEVRAPGAVLSCKERNKAAVFNLYATKQVSDNENVHHRQTYGGIQGYRCHTQRNLTLIHI